MSDVKSLSSPMPVLFFGHGSPMNAIEINRYTQTLNKISNTLSKPVAILSISAHWLTEGTFVTSGQKPKTIHDFYGFPKKLSDFNYPAAGSQETALLISHIIENPQIKFDNDEWGLDHGTWSVLTHIYPNADIPVLQLSLDMTQPAEFHFDLGQKLQKLRYAGVIIIGSGNIVHNLREISWQTDAPVRPWANEFDEWFKDRLLAKDFKSLINDFNLTDAGKKSVPSLDHYLPALYIMGAAFPDEKVRFIYEEIQNASISMRSFQFG